MKKLALMIVAAATLFGTAAYAQGIGVGVGPGGVGVRVDDGYRGDRSERRGRDFRRSRGETVVIERRRGRDWDRRRNKKVYIVR